MDNLRIYIEKHCPNDAIPVIGLDANASIGEQSGEHTNSKRNSIAGMFGDRHESPQSEYFTNFLSENALCTVGTWFKRKNHSTWFLPGSHEGRQYDHFLMPRKNLIKDFKNVAKGLSDEEAAGILAKRYEVSDDAMKFRLKNLGLQLVS